jgi:hypothetical protein
MINIQPDSSGQSSAFSSAIARSSPYPSHDMGLSIVHPWDPYPFLSPEITQALKKGHLSTAGPKDEEIHQRNIIETFTFEPHGTMKHRRNIRNVWFLFSQQP